MKTADFNTEIVMDKRKNIKLRRVEGDVNRTSRTDSLVIWYDYQPAIASKVRDVVDRIGHLQYTGIVVYAENVKDMWTKIGPSLHVVIDIKHSEEFADLTESLGSTPEWEIRKKSGHIIIGSASVEVLADAKSAGLPSCYRAYVDDGDGLHAAIRVGSAHDFLMIRFRDPTNIPLELVIASLQGTKTILIKEISDNLDIDDAIVTLGVMEVGADGVMFSPETHDVLDEFVARLSEKVVSQIQITTATIVKSEPVGMGYRSCIDLATLFRPDEGMLVGSTSQGGIFCCPEVFYLPYMELRPFRVNAGAVHSYVYNFSDRTDYMSELKAGSSVMVVNAEGKTRKAVVGRMKTEIRPLRLIEIEFENKERANILMQDDWHVRIFSHDSKPLNITELKVGDKVLAHQAKPGRHVGIKVDEHIVEV